MQKNVPLYFKLKEQLINDIKNKKYTSHEMIPSENQLCEIYDISRPTVRQAIGELTNMGYLYKIKGKGTFVSDFNEITTYDHTNGFMFSILDCNDATNREILSVKIKNGKDTFNDKKINSFFDLEYAPNVDNKYIIVEYNVKHEGKTCTVCQYYHVDTSQKLDEQLKNNASSIDIIGGKYPLDPMYSKCDVKVVHGKKSITDKLNLPKDAALLVMECQLQSRSGNIVEHNIVFYNGLNSTLHFVKGRKR